LKEAYILDYEKEPKYHLFISETRREINAALMRFASLLTNFELESQIRYFLTSDGKRLRPLLLVMSGQSVGGEREALMPPAIAIELVHTASLIHDDAIDYEKLRRGLPTLYEKLGNRAILVGDMLYALAVTILTRSDPRVMGIVAENTMELCDGEFMDVSFSLDNCREEDYLVSVRKKSASLFKAAAECGAVVGGGLRSDIEALSMFGELFGVAYQLKDDLQEIGGHVSSDLRNGRITLPYLHLYANGDRQSRQLLEENLGRERVPDRVAKEILERMGEVGSIDYCRGKIEEYKAKACNSLTGLREPEYKEYLLRFSHMVLTPQ
jgi:geranylgeranyl pyrophosphate synthase